MSKNSMPNAKKKMIVILGTRPEAIKLAPVILTARQHFADRLDVTLCSTGQHREMLAQALEPFGLATDIDLALMQQSQTLASLSARLLSALEPVLAGQGYDWAMVQGDTSTAMFGAMSAFYQGIRVAHVEAGLRTPSIHSPFPEEMNRRVISQMSTLNFAPTVLAHSRLLVEGHASHQIVMTGNTIVDAIDYVTARWDGRGDTGSGQAAPDLPPGLKPDDAFCLVTAHRRENIGAPMAQIFTAVRDLAARNPGFKFLLPAHLNPVVRDSIQSLLGDCANVIVTNPVGFETSVRLQQLARFIITDSGGVQEEAPTFNTPLLVVRHETERPEGVETGHAKLVGPNYAALMDWGQRLIDGDNSAFSAAPNPYGDGQASQRLLAALLGYQDGEQGDE